MTMTLAVVTRIGSGVLTTDHAASSYGQPVLVIDGRAYGAAEAPPCSTQPMFEHSAEEQEAVEAARRAGYTVY
jgi:hypothetical protein